MPSISSSSNEDSSYYSTGSSDEEYCGGEGVVVSILVVVFVCTHLGKCLDVYFDLHIAGSICPASDDRLH